MGMWREALAVADLSSESGRLCSADFAADARRLQMLRLSSGLASTPSSALSPHPLSRPSPSLSLGFITSLYPDGSQTAS